MKFSGKKSDLFLICDVGSASIGLALIELTFNKVKIVNSVRSHVSLSGRQNSIEKQAVLIKNVLSSTQTFLQNIKPSLSLRGVSKVDDAYVVFSSHWYISKTIVQSIRKNSEFLLDSHTLESIIDQEEKKFEDELMKSSQHRFAKQDLHMIEREVMRIKLNGYDTINPYLKSVKDVDFSLYMSIVPHEMLKSIDQTIRDVFHVKSVIAHSFPLACYESVIKMFPHESELMLIDIGGETTDITVVKDGAIELSHSFPYGRNEMIREISNKLNVPFDVVISYIKMLMDGNLENEIEQDLKNQLQKVSEFWFERLKEIEEVFSGQYITKRVFLTAKNDIINEINTVLEKNKKTVFQVQEEMLTTHIDGTELMSDLSIALDSIMISGRKFKKDIAPKLFHSIT